MKRLAALLAAPLLACDPHGINVGTAELCVKDPRLVLAEARSADEPVSSCALIGEGVLQNAGFETPIVSGCENPLFCQFPAAMVAGWQTSSAEQVIEVWLDGHMNVPAPEGKQFGELNARSRDTVFQDVALEPGQLMFWSLQHRGREGIDSMELRIGPPEAPALVAVLSSPEDAWKSYAGLYRVGPDETLTRLALVSRNGDEQGNLVDAVLFAPVAE